MKKSFFLFSFISFFLIGCPPPIEYTAFSEIEYTARSRGNSDKIVLTFEGITHTKKGKMVFQRSLKRKEFKSLYAFLKDIDLPLMHTIRVPSKKHQFDAAMITTLKVVSRDQKIYTSPSFDHDNPPTELKDLVKYLQRFIQ